MSVTVFSSWKALLVTAMQNSVSNFVLLMTAVIVNREMICIILARLMCLETNTKFFGYPGQSSIPGQGQSWLTGPQACIKRRVQRSDVHCSLHAACSVDVTSLLTGRRAPPVFRIFWRRIRHGSRSRNGKRRNSEREKNDDRDHAGVFPRACCEKK